MTSKSPKFEAVDLLKELKITEPPIDVRKIAKKLKIEIHEATLPDDISGILDVEDNANPRIFVNELHNSNRKRFSIAHEIGHYILHKNVGVHIDKNTFFRDKKSSEAFYPVEIESNKFAAELLMPTELIEKEIENFKRKFDTSDLIDSNDDLLEYLAAKFEVSLTAMSIKLHNFGFSF